MKTVGNIARGLYARASTNDQQICRCQTVLCASTPPTAARSILSSYGGSIAAAAPQHLARLQKLEHLGVDFISLTLASC